MIKEHKIENWTTPIVILETLAGPIIGKCYDIGEGFRIDDPLKVQGTQSSDGSVNFKGFSSADRFNGENPLYVTRSFVGFYYTPSKNIIEQYENYISKNVSSGVIKMVPNPIQ